jgi:hypothetical protein
MYRKIVSIGLLLFGLLLAVDVHAHSPLCSCIDNGDGTVTCEGGFSDGSSAAGVTMEVRDESGRTLTKGRMDKLSTFSFTKPGTRPYKVVFDAGPGHVVEIHSKEIAR